LKLLFDQNLSYKLISALRTEFPDSAHVRDVDLASADDITVWEYAKRFGFAIVSKDVDFSQRSFLFGAPPKIIWVKVGNCSTRQIEDLLRSFRNQILNFESDRESAFLIVAPFSKTGARQDLPVNAVRVPVVSSIIAFVQYDPESQILEVGFKATGDMYRYFDVPAAEYEALLSATSKGNYLNSRIKPNFRCKKVG
jgi:predicted nuclease of predicted toxin-antitoxin system